MPKLGWMNEVHFEHLLERALGGEEKAARELRYEWDLQRARVEHLKETGEDMKVEDYKAWAANRR